jgi:Domain of unknown function DUF29
MCDRVKLLWHARKMDARYKSDFYAWTQDQAALARARSSNAFDWDNVALELAALGKTESRELRSRFVVLISHLLKWLMQPERQSRSWANTIANQREEIVLHLDDNPSLKASEQAIFDVAYGLARRTASSETDLDLDLFPAVPPFNFEQARQVDWFPPPQA